MTFRSALVLAVLSATPAAAQRVSFPNFTGPGAAGLRNQLVGAVCDTADCVAATRTTTSGKPDWKKAKKESVPFFVTGAVVKKGKALQLDLAVLNKAGAPKARKSFPLDKNGTLAPKSLQAAMDLLTQAFGSGPQAPPEKVTPPVEPTRPPPREPPPGKPLTRPPDPPRVEKAPEPERRGEPPPPPQPVEPQQRLHSFLVIEVGAEVLNRKLEYTQVATSNLRRYDLAAFLQPAVGLEFYPLALVSDDLLAGLGVEFGLATAPWLQSRLASLTDAFPTSTMRIDAGLRFNIMPIKTYALSLAPYVGFRSQSFTVAALGDGRRIDGLPNIAFLGLRAGLALEVPIVPGWLTAFGRFGIIPVLGSGEIISPTFFAQGSAFGLEAQGGLGVRILPFLQVRASFEFTRYGMTFTTQPTDTYVATGASDTYLGGRAVFHFSF